MKLIKCKIKDLGTVLTGNTPPTSQRKYYGDLYPLIKPTDMKIDTRYIGDTEERLSEEGYKLFQRRLLPRYTTCVVTIGTIGKLCLTKEPSFCNQAVNSIIVNRKLYDPLYVFYLMKTSISKVKFLSSGTASGRENVSKTAFENIEIQVHELKTQNKIASILSTYDDLIENNTRRIKILEEMVQTLYHEWFVKFRFPGHEHTKMVDSELGLIPEGWEVTKIGNACLVGDGAHARIKRQDAGIMYLTCKNFKGGDLELSKVDYISEDDYQKYFKEDSKALTKPKLGDVVFSIIGTIGEPYLVQPQDKFGISSSLSILRPYQNILSSNYLYYWIRNRIFQDALNGIKGGVAQGYVSLEMIKSLPLYYPKKSLQDNFDNYAAKILSLIQLLNRKNSNLRQTRDLLLPKLISGQIDVERLEITTEDIAA